MNYIKSSEFADVLNKYCRLDKKRQIKYICPTEIGVLSEELEQLALTGVVQPSAEVCVKNCGKTIPYNNGKENICLNCGSSI